MANFTTQEIKLTPITITIFVVVGLALLLWILWPKPPLIVSGRFDDMKSCVEIIREKAGPLSIRTDTPQRVSGRTVYEYKKFACELKVTGTEGTYYYGWFEAERK